MGVDNFCKYESVLTPSEAIFECTLQWCQNVNGLAVSLWHKLNKQEKLAIIRKNSAVQCLRYSYKLVCVGTDA